MYFVTETAPFGGVSWLMVLVWLGVLAAAVMAMRGRVPSNPVRAAFRRRTALGALVVSALGLVQLAVRLIDGRLTNPEVSNVPVLDWRLWSYLILLGGLAFLGYTIWYYRTRYPLEVASSKHVRVVRPAQPRREQALQRPAAAPAEPAEPRPVATTSRRDARRDRKRRKR